jgi:U5 small nuclear ribonucleoprotein component
MVEEEDAQPLTEPIINPIKVRKFTIVEKGEAVPETTFSKQLS